MTGVVLSAPTNEQPKCPLAVKVNEVICTSCKLFVDWALLNQIPWALKPKLDQLCAKLQPEEKAKKCQEAVDKYIHDVETMKVEDFCKEIKLCQ